MLVNAIRRVGLRKLGASLNEVRLSCDSEESGGMLLSTWIVSLLWGPRRVRDS